MTPAAIFLLSVKNKTAARLFPMLVISHCDLGLMAGIDLHQDRSVNSFRKMETRIGITYYTKGC